MRSWAQTGKILQRYATVWKKSVSEIQSMEQTQNVGGRVKRVIGGRALLGGEEPGDHGALLAVLVGEETSYLAVINAPVHVDQGHDVSHLVICPL